MLFRSSTFYVSNNHMFLSYSLTLWQFQRTSDLCTREWNTFISKSVVQDAWKPQHTESIKPKVTLGGTPPLDNPLPLLLLTSFPHTQSYHELPISCYTNIRAAYLHAQHSRTMATSNLHGSKNIIYLVFQGSYHVQSTVVQKICYKHGSYMLDCSIIPETSQQRMNPAHNKHFTP